jgi:hypothetical protein
MEPFALFERQTGLRVSLDIAVSLVRLRHYGVLPAGIHGRWIPMDPRNMPEWQPEEMITPLCGALLVSCTQADKDPLKAAHH